VPGPAQWSLLSAVRVNNSHVRQSVKRVTVSSIASRVYIFMRALVRDPFYIRLREKLHSLDQTNSLNGN